MTRLRAWVEQVYRPGYGHSPAPSAPAGPPMTCTPWTSPAACGRCCILQPGRDAVLLSAQAEYQARILPALAAQLAAETTRCGHTRPRSTP